MQPLFGTFSLGREYRLTMVDRPRHLRYEDVADELYTGYPRNLELTDILVVRPPVDQAIDDPETEVKGLSEMVERAPRASLHLLYSRQFDVSLSRNLNHRVVDRLRSASDKMRFLQWLQAAELREYVSRSSALFKAHKHFIYKAPSHKYVEMFLRVGNVQMSRQAIDAFFFWMIPYLRDRDAIMTDTWSISSIALNAARLLERYAPDRRCRVDMLASYFDGSAALVRETREVLRRIGAGRSRVLVLISAAATGGSLRRLQQVVGRQQATEDQFRFLSLYRLGSTTEVDTLCDVSDGFDGDSFKAIPDPGHRTVVDIDRYTYFPLHIRDTRMNITKEAASPARPFFDRYQGTTSVRLHCDAYDLNGQRLRHHGIDLDVEAMLKVPQFVRRLKRELSRLDRLPAAIIVPPHRAGEEMASVALQLLGQKFGSPPTKIVHADLSPEAGDTPRERITSLSDDELVLVMDDVSCTGRRLKRYQVNLRELEYGGRIAYVVGVARPESDEVWENRVKELRIRDNRPMEQHLVACAERVVLPNWSERECPWCLELEDLKSIYPLIPLEGAKRVVARRLGILDRSMRGQGLVHDALWRLTDNTGPYLTRDSVFLTKKNPTDADVIASVGAALQQMRTWRKLRRLESLYPSSVVINPIMYCGESPRYNDDIIRLAILRIARRSELECSDDRQEGMRQKNVRADMLCYGPHCDTTRLELAIAISAGRLPKPMLAESDWEQLAALPYDLLLREIIRRAL